MQKAEFWIRHLGLERHPEGGWYRETYRSSSSFDFGAESPFGSPRPFATSIHYLLEQGDRSRLHRIHSDELWYFHAGSPLEVHLFPEAGSPSSFTLGDPAEDGQVLHDWVPAGCRFGARMKESAAEGTFSLVSCVVAPGFDFRDFSFVDRNRLIAQYPDHEWVIKALT
jgi:hypothetical protein